MIRASNWLFIGFIFISSTAFSQDSLLTYEEFMDRVMEFHPQVFRADLKSEEGGATLQQSKGGFDPSVGGKAKQKYFDDKQYYSHLNGYLKVPTWFGITAEAGYDNTGGVFLNPSDRLPDAGLWYAGLNIELGNGLLIDERRASLKKARLYNDATDIERKIMRNELYFNATNAYLKWAKSYELYVVFQNAVETSEIRLEAVKSYVEFGDRPAINITEARIQYQNMLLNLQQAELEWQNSSRGLELYLWDDGFIPLEIDGAVPQPLNLVQMSDELVPVNLVDSVMVAHPLLQLTDLSIQQSEIDLRLKKEYLKPKVSLSYRALNEPVNNGILVDYSIANYTWGASVSYPIFTRQERGNVRLSEIKLESQRLKQYELENKIDYQVEIGINTIRTMQNQLDVSLSNVEDYQTLLDAEINLFYNGESSLFMVNSRELKLMDAQIKFVEVKTKLQIAKAELKYQLLILDNQVLKF